MFELILVVQDNCPPCHKYEPIFKQYTKDIPIESKTKTSIEDFNNCLYKEYVKTTPTVLLIKDNNVVLIWKGIASEKDVSDAILGPHLLMKRYGVK